MKNNFNLKGLIVGCGSIGERHLYNLKCIGIDKIAIFDKNKKRASELSRKYKVEKFHDLKSALSFNPDFSIVSTYANSHTDLALQCINTNSHVFIEKPISSE